MTHAELGYRGPKAMEINKPKAVTPAEKAFSAKKATDFVGDIKTELVRITWPSWEELKMYTQIVVAATFAFGVGLYFSDLFIHYILTGLGMFMRLISG